MMQPLIAVLTPNILTGIGLKAILEKVIPVAEVELYSSVEALGESSPERFSHCFVALQLYRRHREQFAALGRRVILLGGGEPHEEEPGMHSLNICQSEEELIRDLVQMHRHAHPGRGMAPHPVEQRSEQLTDREAEVLRLLARGRINKEIADEMGIGLTTVITHRRNMMEKLRLKSVAELMLYAIRNGYAPTDTL